MTWLQKENPQITPEKSKNKINRKPAAQPTSIRAIEAFKLATQVAPFETT
jgi:hypothetical protein